VLLEFDRAVEAMCLRAVKRTAGLPFPGLHGFRNFDLFKLGNGQAALIHNGRFASIGIDQAAEGVLTPLVNKVQRDCAYVVPAA
jgi:hypothetical protein